MELILLFDNVFDAVEPAPATYSSADASVGEQAIITYNDDMVAINNLFIMWSVQILMQDT